MKPIKILFFSAVLILTMTGLGAPAKGIVAQNVDLKTSDGTS